MLNKNFIINPKELNFYIRNYFQTNSNLVKKIIKNDLNKDFIENIINLLKIHILKYGNLSITLTPKSINSKHLYFMQIAVKEAKKSLLNHQHGCVIVYQNKVVSCGHNKGTINYTHYKSIHAEEDAIRNLVKINKFQSKNIRNNCKLYVVRIQKKTNLLKMSRPCQNCINNIKKHNIGVTYYSTNDTFIDDLISQYIIYGGYNYKL